MKPRSRRCAAPRSLPPKTQIFVLTLDSRWRGGQNTGGYRATSRSAPVNPNSAEAHNNLGLALLGSGKRGKALPNLKRPCVSSRS